MELVTLKVLKEYTCDVLVVGGGVAGFSAAVCAARQGANVMLCEAGGVLGGTATQGLVGPFMTCYDGSGKTQIIRGFFSEVVERLIQEHGAISPALCPSGDSHSGYRTVGHIGVTPFSPEVLKRVAEDMCEEAGVKILYHSRLVDCATENDTIHKAYFAGISGIEAVSAKVFVDTTGDATMAAHAGAEVIRGDENGLVQTASLFFQIRGVDKEPLDAYMAEHHEMRKRFFMDEIAESRSMGEFPCGTPKLRIYEGPTGIWTVNMAQEDEQINELDTESLTEAEISQRKSIPAIIAFLKKTIPGLQNIELVTSASNLGVRESRRIVGKSVLTKEDVLNGNCYDERIAVCSNSMDYHLANSVNYIAHASDKNYYIPLSCLISKNIKNLLAAGKTVSADKYAFSAIRVMPPCFAMGQAAGITAALAVRGGGNVSDVKVSAVQQEITKNGGYLE